MVRGKGVPGGSACSLGCLPILLPLSEGAAHLEGIEMNLNSVVFGGRVFSVTDSRKVGDSQVREIRMKQSRKKQDGSWAEIWLNVVCWGRLAESVGDFKRGDKITAEGEIQYEEWEKNGERKNALKIKARRVHQDFDFNKNRPDGETSSKPKVNPVENETPF
jgi:single-stranded DNA-binding protein